MRILSDNFTSKSCKEVKDNFTSKSCKEVKDVDCKISYQLFNFFC